jgi:ADP-ribosylglycohydrolase
MATLYEKVYGCLAASRVGSSMGAAVEGWMPERIKEVHGFVDRLMPYKHYQHRGIDWERMPGTTEDGIERQKLMTQAIITKQDRITAEDLYKTVVDVTDLDKIWYMTEPSDIRVLKFMTCGVPAIEVGRLSGWHDLNFNRACQPIGLINACDPAGADRDVRDIGRLWYPPTDRGLIWAGVYVAAIAEACRPGATVESVVEVGKRYGDERIQREIDRAIDIAQRASGDWEAMRDEFYTIYNGGGIPYAACYASETVSKGLAVFVHARGDAKTAVLTGVNFGRDTDCLAATAGGLAGAFSGIGALPEEWVKQVDEATFANPYTNIQCTIQEHAEGVYRALQNRAQKMSALAQTLASA